MASNRGTLMELGISPIITSSMIMQVQEKTGSFSSCRFLNRNVFNCYWLILLRRKLVSITLSICKKMAVQRLWYMHIEEEDDPHSVQGEI